MKSTKKWLFGMIALIVGVMLTFSMVGCGDAEGGGGTPAHVHQWGNWSVTTAATCMAKGTEIRTCTLEQTHKETREIAIDPTAHVWGQWNKTIEPTCTEKGKGSRVCTLNQ